MIPNFLKQKFGRLFEKFENYSSTAKMNFYRKNFNLHPTVKLFQIRETTFRGTIIVGEGTYFNRCWLESGPNSKIVIGKWCAIGYNTFIMSITHDSDFATGPESDRPAKESDIIIGDNVWIGVNVYIRQGVEIGSNSVIGANSVVTKNIPPNSINAGVPAKLIRYKKSKL